jgi:hypothetical protein
MIGPRPASAVAGPIQRIRPDVRCSRGAFAASINALFLSGSGFSETGQTIPDPNHPVIYRRELCMKCGSLVHNKRFSVSLLTPAKPNVRSSRNFHTDRLLAIALRATPVGTE